MNDIVLYHICIYLYDIVLYYIDDGINVHWICLRFAY